MAKQISKTFIGDQRFKIPTISPGNQVYTPKKGDKTWHCVMTVAGAVNNYIAINSASCYIWVPAYPVLLKQIICGAICLRGAVSAQPIKTELSIGDIVGNTPIGPVVPQVLNNQAQPGPTTDRWRFVFDDSNTKYEFKNGLPLVANGAYYIQPAGIGTFAVGDLLQWDLIFEFDVL